MGVADTAPDVRRRQIEAYRTMSPQRRVDIALAMSQEAQIITVDGIRSRDESLDEKGVRRELLRIMHGTRLAQAMAAASPTR